MVKISNGETRKTLSSLAKEINENRVSIEVLKTEIQQTNMVHKRLDTAIEKNLPIYRQALNLCWRYTKRNYLNQRS